MSVESLVAALRGMKDCFDRSTDCLEESDSGFAPETGMMTVAQQVAHVARTIDWFVEGAFRPEGFDLDFAGHEQEVRKVESLDRARQWLNLAITEAIETFLSKSPEEFAAPIAAGPIMGGAPRSAIVAGMTDHTAHHRGALTVYARLRGRRPAMPYA